MVSLRFLKPSNQLQMDKLYKLFRLLPDAIHWYLNEFIFPVHTPQQIVKLSASGQEVGGDMLFGRRLGFSGTPSDLLPKELGSCGYEQGTDGRMMYTLQTPEIVSFRYASPAGGGGRWAGKWVVAGPTTTVTNKEQDEAQAMEGAPGDGT